jgi:hypothetical protein
MLVESLALLRRLVARRSRGHLARVPISGTPSRRVLAFALLLVLGSILGSAREAEAARPFVIEEAEVVGKKLVRLESWVVATRDLLAHAGLLGIGAGEHLEVKLGAVHGGVYGRGVNGYGVRGPLLEIDAMFLAPTWKGRPGLGMNVGVITPLGYQTFRPPGWSGFGGLRYTQPLFRDHVRLHGNVGVSNGERGEDVVDGQRAADWLYGGVGLELRFSERTQAVLEYFHRDPYGTYATWAAVHAGFRYWFRESIGVDGGLGVTLPYAGGDERARVFGTIGLRLTTPVRW